MNETLEQTLRDIYAEDAGSYETAGAVSRLHTHTNRVRTRRHRLLRVSVAGGTSVVLALMTIGAINLGGNSDEATAATKVLDRFAKQTQAGLGASKLQPGQAWFTKEIDSITSPWQPPATRGQTNSPPGSVPPQINIEPNSRAIVVTRYRMRKWVLYDGDSRGGGDQIGDSQFYGSPADHVQWVADGSHAPVQISTHNAQTGNPAGFSVGSGSLTYRQVLNFPTTPSAVLKLVTGGLPGDSDAPNALTDLTNVLVQVPLLPAARAAVFRAMAQLPGVKYIGAARDPLGRSGVAFAIDSTARSDDLSNGGPRSTTDSRLRAEVIFDQRSAALLAQETFLLNPPSIARVQAPLAIRWSAYLTSRIVSGSSAPTLKQLGLPPQPTGVPASPLPGAPQVTRTSTTASGTSAG
jgi:hypothetical protein